MLCCVIAADKKINRKEVQAVVATLADCSTKVPESVAEVVVTYCKDIHAKGVDKHVLELVPQLAARRDSSLSDIFDKARQTLIGDDADSTEKERRVADRLAAAFLNPQTNRTGNPSVPLTVGSGTPVAVAEGTETTAATVTQGIAAWKVAVAIWVFFPYGLYLLWNHPELSKNKWWWRCGIAYAVVALVVAINGADKRKHQSGDLDGKASQSTAVSPEERWFERGRSAGQQMATHFLRQKYNPTAHAGHRNKLIEGITDARRKYARLQDEASVLEEQFAVGLVQGFDEGMRRAGY